MSALHSRADARYWSFRLRTVDSLLTTIRPFMTSCSNRQQICVEYGVGLFNPKSRPTSSHLFPLSFYHRHLPISFRQKAANICTCRSHGDTRIIFTRFSQRKHFQFYPVFLVQLHNCFRPSCIRRRLYNAGKFHLNHRSMLSSRPLPHPPFHRQPRSGQLPLQGESTTSLKHPRRFSISTFPILLPPLTFFTLLITLWLYKSLMLILFQSKISTCPRYHHFRALRKLPTTLRCPGLWCGARRRLWLMMGSRWRLRLGVLWMRMGMGLVEESSGSGREEGARSLFPRAVAPSLLL